MVYQKSNLSKIATLLLLIAISKAETSCNGMTFYHDTAICDISERSYNNPAEMCSDFDGGIITEYETLFYCRHDTCDECSFVSNCYLGEEFYLGMTYTKQSPGQVYGLITNCKMEFGEQCYKESGGNLGKTAYNDNIADVDSLPDCCMVECDDIFGITGEGCGSDGDLYADFNTFCAAYCNNRQLVYTACGQPGCGQTEGCTSSDIEICAQSYPDGEFPVCGSDGVLYETATDYCTAKEENSSISYSKNYCNPTCTQDSCEAQMCELDLEVENYTADTICGTSGTFYQTQEDYCTAISTEAETDFIFCDSEACLTQTECCVAHCITDNAGFAAGCGSDYQYYSTVDDFCDAQCTEVPNLTKILCSELECTESECCGLRCNNENTYDVCNLDGYSMITSAEYCNEECDNDGVVYLIEGCTDDQEVARHCTTDDCNYKSCINTNDTANGPVFNYCGNNGTLYTTTVDYCTALEIDKAIDNSVTCEDGSCSDQTECCINYCKQVLFDNGDTYNAICNSTTYDYIESVDDYCASACGTGTYVEIEPIDCNNGGCTADECCIERCNNTGDFDDVCSDAYEVILANDCATQCDSNATLYTCDGDCTQDDCDIKECVAGMSEYPGTAVCAKNANGNVLFYAGDDAYCTAKQAEDSITSFECEDGECNDSAECCYNNCLAENPDYQPLCDESYHIYETVEDYCNEECTNGITRPDCNGNDCTRLECCEYGCNSQEYTTGCDPETHELVLKETYCNNTCVNNTPMIMDVCRNEFGDPDDCGDCKAFECEDDTATYTHGSVCLNDTINGSYYFSSVTEYCDAAILANETTFNLDSVLLCGENNDTGCTEDECCTLICESNDTYLPSCDTTTYQYYDLPAKCNAECVNDETLTLTDCTTGCTEEDCSVMECVAALTDSTDYSKICLTTEVAGEYYFDSLDDYCRHLVQNELTFTIDGQIGCNDEACVDFDTCCSQRCDNETYFDSCNAETFDLVLKTEHCNYRCLNRSDIEVVGCVNEMDSADNCNESDCSQKECVKDNAEYEYTTVCLPSSNDTVEFFESVSLYCDNLIENNITDYVIENSLSCEGGECSDEDACCYSFCLTQSYVLGCDPTSFDLVSIENYCSSYCADKSYTPLECDGVNDCTEDQCHMKECEHVLDGYELGTICLSNRDNQESYFDSHTAYCQAKIANSDRDYSLDAEDYVTCEGVACPDADSCCHSQCDNGAYLLTCSSDNYSIVDKEAYCNDLCGEAVLETFSCEENGIPADCSEANCCAKELIDTQGDMAFCGSDGTLYNTSLNFCEAQVNDQSLTVVACDGECSAEECNISHCLANTTLTEADFPFCGSDGILYNDVNQYCTALSTDDSLAQLDICTPETCTQEICCDSGCEGRQEAVLYIDDNGALAGFDNNCYSNCSGTEINIIHNCAADTSVADCITAFSASCDTTCSSKAADTTTYCGLTEGFLTAYEYCLIYECPEGSKHNQTFDAVPGCENNTCDESSCTINTCIVESDCSSQSIDIVCGNDGDSYRNPCEAVCHETTVNSDCADPENPEDSGQVAVSLASCKNTCADLVCEGLCGTEGEPVCGDNGTVYDNACLAECYGNDVSFECPVDCRGNRRGLRCTYECQASL